MSSLYILGPGFTFNNSRLLPRSKWCGDTPSFISAGWLGLAVLAQFFRVATFTVHLFLLIFSPQLMHQFVCDWMCMCISYWQVLYIFFFNDGVGELIEKTLSPTHPYHESWAQDTLLKNRERYCVATKPEKNIACLP